MVLSAIAMLDTAPSGAVAANRLLSAISFEDLQRFAPRLRRVTVRAGQILQRRSERAEGVYFLNSGLCSITRETDDGHQIEVASVGNEGLIGIAAVDVGAEAAGAAATATMLIGGEAHWIAIESFRREISRHDSVASVTGRYLETFISDLMTSVACHALHPLDQRLAKWLLQAQDRIGGATVPLTHDVLSMSRLFAR